MAYLQSSMVGDESLHAARVVAPIHTVLTAKTRSRNFDRHFYCSTAWPYCKMAVLLNWNQLMTVDYTHILSCDPIMYGRKRSNPTPTLVYGVKMPGLSCYYEWPSFVQDVSDLNVMFLCHRADGKVPRTYSCHSAKHCAHGWFDSSRSSVSIDE